MPSASPIVAKPLSLAWQVRHIISQRKQMRRLRPTARLFHKLHLDLVDVVDVSLAAERFFDITVPDEIPLHTVGDLVQYVDMHQSAASQS